MTAGKKERETFQIRWCCWCTLGGRTQEEGGREGGREEGETTRKDLLGFFLWN